MLVWGLVFLAIAGALPARAQDPPAANDAFAPLSGVERARWRADRQRLRAEISVRARAGKWDEVEALTRQELARSREILGELHDDTIATRGRLAISYERRGDWAAARKILAEILALRERQPDRKDWKVGDAREKLADLNRRAAMTPLQRAQWAEALNLLTRTSTSIHASTPRQRAQYEAALPPLQVVRQLNDRQDPEWALKNAQEATRILRELLGEDHPDYARANAMIGHVYEVKGDYARAEPYLRRLLEIDKKARGKSHPRYAFTLKSLAQFYEKMGDQARAEPLLRQALASITEAYGYDQCPFDLLSGVASRYLERGDSTHAERLIRQMHAVLISMYNVGNYDNALRPAETAAKLARQGLGEGHPLHLESLSLLARMYMTQTDYARAEPPLRRAVEITKRARGESHPDYARALNDLADLYKAKGDYDAAEPLVRGALEIARKSHGEWHPDYARALGGLSGLYQTKGDYASAEQILCQAMEIVRRARGESAPDYVRTLNDVANLYRDMGDYARAEPLYRQTIEIASKMNSLGLNPNSPLNPLYLRGLLDLAELYRARGDYGRAEPLLREAVVRRFSQYDLNHAAGLDALANLYLEMGDDVRAEPPLGQALEIRRKAQGESHPDYARSLSTLARVYAARGDYDRAEPLRRQAMDVQKEARGESHPDYAAALGDLADLYVARGDYARAEPPLRQAVEARRKTQGESHPDYARSLSALARVYAARGDYNRAEPLCQQALEIQRQALGESHPDYAAALGDLADVYVARGDFGRAEPPLRQALDHASAWLRDLSSALGERQRFRLYAAGRRFLDGFLSVTPEVGAEPANLYARVLDWKGVVDAEVAEDRLARDEPELNLRLVELARIHALLGRHAFNPAGFNRRSLAELNARKEGLEADLASRSAAFRQSRRESPPGPQQVMTFLSGDEALIDLFEYTHSGPADGGKGPLQRERRLLAFILRAGRPVTLVPLGPARPVTEAVRGWRAALVAGRADGMQAASAALGRRVWEPIRPHLEGARTVLIAADGALLSFPFATLPAGRPDSYLIDELTLGYVTSGRTLVRTRAARPGPPGRGLLAVGGVDFRADPGRSQPSDRPRRAPPAPVPLLVQRSGFAPLPGTLPEAASVRALYRAAFPDQPADLLVGADPSEYELKRRLNGGHVRVVHLATHGFFESSARFGALRARILHLEPSVGLAPTGQQADDTTASALTRLVRSGVVLTGGGAIDPAKSSLMWIVRSNYGVGEDGILTAEEVQALDLRGTDLVVLSACDTGLGDLEAGQGVLGLQRAFQLAGARAVVASLWRVDDAATAVLMERFYDNLWVKKMPRLEALRQAQLAVLHDPALVRARRTELAQRGIGEKPEKLPAGGIMPAPNAAPARSHPSLWAAFVLSGDGR
jgi:CHAT domain-containing protein/Tfp pilus assembly protein PilF